MKHWYFEITIQYCGLEWIERGVIEGKNEEEVRKEIKLTDFTHENSGEEQELTELKEVSLDDYAVLDRYLLSISRPYTL